MVYTWLVYGVVDVYWPQVVLMICTMAVAAVCVNNTAPLPKISIVDNEVKTTRNNICLHLAGRYQQWTSDGGSRWLWLRYVSISHLAIHNHTYRHKIIMALVRMAVIFDDVRIKHHKCYSSVLLLKEWRTFTMFNRTEKSITRFSSEVKHSSTHFLWISTLAFSSKSLGCVACSSVLLLLYT